MYSQEVVCSKDPSHRGTAGEAAVGAMPVVVMQPLRERQASLRRIAIEASVRPLELSGQYVKAIRSWS
jgi:hypothetical protein